MEMKDILNRMLNHEELSAHPINQGEDSFILQKIYTFVP